MGGKLEDVACDLETIEQMGGALGLVLNHSKSEVICADEHTRQSILSVSPHLQCTDQADACLLGSPIGGPQSITKVLSSKKQSLELMGERLKLLHSHDALCLLKNALALPKILYVLRSAPCFSCSILAELDRLQRSLLEAICNVTLSYVAWSQASLPTRAGGLGIRKFTMLATPAFLASAAGSASLAGRILPPSFADIVCPFRADALSLWSQVHTRAPVWLRCHKATGLGCPTHRVSHDLSPLLGR